jgi:hypothetical protein
MVLKDWVKKGNIWRYQGLGDKWLRLDHSNNTYTLFLHSDKYNSGQIGGIFKTEAEAVKFARGYMRLK